MRGDILEITPAASWAGFAAAALVADPARSARLGDLLALGEPRRRAVWALVRGMGRMELDGLALGARLPAAETLARVRVLTGAGLTAAAMAGGGAADPPSR